MVAVSYDVYKGGSTPLYIACEKGHVEVAKLMLSSGADVDKARTDVSISSSPYEAIYTYAYTNQNTCIWIFIHICNDCSLSINIPWCGCCIK